MGEFLLSLFVLRIGFVSTCIVFRRAPCVALGSRELAGAAETLLAQRVVLREVGISVAFPLRGRKQPQAVG